MAIVVNDYNEFTRFYTEKLGFELAEDTYQSEQDKRWVVVRPKGENSTSLLLAQASNPEQSKAVGAQSGGRVFLFLETDDFWQDYNAYVEKGIEFAQPPVEAEYGTVAVFKECHSNLWDLIQYNKSKSA